MTYKKNEPNATPNEFEMLEIETVHSWIRKFQQDGKLITDNNLTEKFREFLEKNLHEGLIAKSLLEVPYETLTKILGVLDATKYVVLAHQLQGKEFERPLLEKIKNTLENTSFQGNDEESRKAFLAVTDAHLNKLDKALGHTNHFNDVHPSSETSGRIEMRNNSNSDQEFIDVSGELSVESAQSDNSSVTELSLAGSQSSGFSQTNLLDLIPNLLAKPSQQNSSTRNKSIQDILSVYSTYPIFKGAYLAHFSPTNPTSKDTLKLIIDSLIAYIGLHRQIQKKLSENDSNDIQCALKLVDESPTNIELNEVRDMLAQSIALMDQDDDDQSIDLLNLSSTGSRHTPSRIEENSTIVSNKQHDQEIVDDDVEVLSIGNNSSAIVGTSSAQLILNTNKGNVVCDPNQEPDEDNVEVLIMSSRENTHNSKQMKDSSSVNSQAMVSISTSSQNQTNGNFHANHAPHSPKNSYQEGSDAINFSTPGNSFPSSSYQMGDSSYLQHNTRLMSVPTDSVTVGNISNTANQNPEDKRAVALNILLGKFLNQQQNNRNTFNTNLGHTTVDNDIAELFHQLNDQKELTQEETEIVIAIYGELTKIDKNILTNKDSLASTIKIIETKCPEINQTKLNQMISNQDNDDRSSVMSIDSLNTPSSAVRSAFFPTPTYEPVTLYVGLPTANSAITPTIHPLNNVENVIDSQPTLQQLHTSEGLKVIAASSGESYNYSLRPKAMTSSNEYSHHTHYGFNAPNDEDENIKLALTIMNMMENIVSHSKNLKIKTDNSLAAALADVYYEYFLKASGLNDLKYQNKKFTKASTEDQRILTAQAIEIFKKIIPYTDVVSHRTQMQETPWYQAALQVQPEEKLRLSKKI